MPLSRRDLIIQGLSAKPVLVCIFQRGAADGLNSIVPYGDADYYRLRPKIAVPRPGQDKGAIRLNDFFGLHPALAPLKPWYDKAQLAVVQACGLPHNSRSHFDAQTLTESGVTEKKQIADSGWIGRYLAATARTNSPPLRAVAIGNAVPVSLFGAGDPLAMENLSGADIAGLKNGGFQNTLRQLYPPSMPFAAGAIGALSIIDELAAAELAQFTPRSGAVYPAGPLGARLRQAAQLIRANRGTEVICIDSDGWDHHVNLPEILAIVLAELANALSAFATDLGAELQRVNVVVMSEFGRRVAENASRGTDHGTAGCVYLLGGGVRGGQIAGRWPGLTEAALASGEDLAITTDLRGVLVQLLQRRFGYAAAAGLFPNYTVPNYGATPAPELFRV